VSVSLRPGASGVLGLTQVTVEPEYQELALDLLRQRDSLLNDVFPDASVDRYREANRSLGKPVPIFVLLSGGSAGLPAFQALASGRCKIREAEFEFVRLEGVPRWVSSLPRDLSELTAREFSQCAVAIGGCAPELPQERSDLGAPVSGAQKGTRRLERYQVTGV
jgi:hypothetical protein